MHLKLDYISLEILKLLQENSKLTPKEIGKKLNRSPSTVAARIKRLEDNGTIKDYITRINLFKTGKKVVSFTQVRLKEHSEEKLTRFQNTIMNIAEVANGFHLAGTFDYILLITATDMNQYHDILTNKLRSIENVELAETGIILKELKGSALIDFTNLTLSFYKNPSLK